MKLIICVVQGTFFEEREGRRRGGEITFTAAFAAALSADRLFSFLLPRSSFLEKTFLLPRSSFLEKTFLLPRSSFLEKNIPPSPKTSLPYII